MTAMDADCMHLKRSFAQVATSTYILLDASECNSSTARLVRSYEGASDRGRALPTKRRLAAFPTIKMPVQTGPSLVSTSLSPFTQNFGDAADCALQSQREDDHQLYTQPLQQSKTTTAFLPTVEPSISFEHRESISSSALSESTGSSPTTTISTFDTPSVTDTSPSSSPESPSALPISYPKPMILPEISERIAMPSVAHAPSIPAQPIQSSARAPSPGRRARNLKNLSLKTPCSSSRPAVSTASIMETTSQNFSAPPSPSFRPIKTGRRKPANLTIRTPSSDQSFSRSITEIIPPTPSIQRSLRHFESSPSLASIFSPTTVPPGGMQLPRPATRDGLPLMPGSWLEDSPVPSQSGPALQQVVEEDYHLDSRESTKRTEKSYPDGPIKIYDSGVYLYLEPTRAEACKFDVVVNVAKEVVNPFADDVAKTDTVVSTLRRPLSVAKRFSIAEPMTAISEASFHSAFEVMPSESESPTTPKAENSTLPEYIHVPWDHNSEILDDLTPLCQLIDDRISQGKSVLIHCQLGASRSASLVIAYGLYKNRDLDFNDMYSIVKDKSCWVGPNMSLIYQLTDFRSRLQRGEPSKPPKQEWFKTQPLLQPSQPSLSKPSQPSYQNAVPEPMDAIEPRKTEQIEPAFLKPVRHTEPSRSTDRIMKAGPPQLRKSKSGLRVRGISPRPLPLREKYPDSQSDRSATQTELRKVSHARYPSVQMDLVMQDVPASPSILSPMAAPYMCSSLSRTLAGDLAGDAPSHFLGSDQPFFDPRSPSQPRELLITRNIDEVL